MLDAAPPPQAARAPPPARPPAAQPLGPPPMSFDFIFMLTRNDRTVPDALVHAETALALGLRHIGFKDVGLPERELARLNARLRAGGATTYLEVVSLDAETELRSASVAAAIGVDHLLGGTRAELVAPVLATAGIRYSPFPGRITGHPSVLEGGVEEIAASAARLAARDDVHGLDLLAYRHAGDVPALMRAVCAATPKPVIMAGSIADPGRIEAAAASGAAGFTIGTAALDGAFPGAGAGLSDQLSAIAAATLRAGAVATRPV